MFVMGLGLLGALSLGGGIAGVGDGLARRDGYQGSFFTGALATVVATPCTAPFMGAAVGFAVTQPPLVALTVFAALGAGMALPFLALTAFPSALRLLPRPGAWMETLKRVLSVPLFLTVAWLAWVLSQQVGTRTFWGFAGGFPLLAAILAVRGLSRGGDVAGARLGIGAGVAALLVAVLAFDAGGARAPAQGANWEPFSRVRLNTLRAEGRTILVDVTAAWCITCQVNDRTTLTAESVRSAFAAGRVAFLKADWTRLEPEIGAFLAENGREGVPLYLLYRGGGDPEVLPQILTPGIVLDALGKPAARVAGG
jgi:thiol:disulfide interchange protein DsbD